MHTLHTTHAYVVGSHPHGESNRVYRLFTRDLGLVYAHGQGVRELKNRNRYGLVTGASVTVTLVRGREVWRITSVRADTRPSPELRMRKFLSLAGSLVPREEKNPELYTLLAEAERAFGAHGTDGIFVELYAALGMLRILGYLDHAALPEGLAEHLVRGVLNTETLALLRAEHQTLVRRVNSALADAL